MKKINLKNVFALTSVAFVLSACGSSSGDSDSDIPILGAASGINQTASAANTNYVGITDEELGALAVVPETNTSRLQVLDDFTFDTSRGTTVNMFIPEAIGQSAEATFCTEFTRQANGAYDVNYDSCVLTAPLFDGAVNEELNLVNQHSSVVGVVWFQNPENQPIYQEFHFD